MAVCHPFMLEKVMGGDKVVCCCRTKGNGEAETAVSKLTETFDGSDCLGLLIWEFHGQTSMGNGNGSVDI